MSRSEGEVVIVIATWNRLLRAYLTGALLCDFCRTLRRVRLIAFRALTSKVPLEDTDIRRDLTNALIRLVGTQVQITDDLDQTGLS